MSKQITKAEQDFCKLLVFGGAKYQYKPEECYKKAILDYSEYQNEEVQLDAVKSANILMESKKLQKEDRIVEYIKELLESKKNEYDTQVLKEMVLDTTKNVMMETATHVSYDESGNKVISPTMRQTSLKAVDTLMKLMPSIKEDDGSDNYTGTANITLNVTPHVEFEDDEK